VTWRKSGVDVGIAIDDEALRMTEQVELQLDDVPPANARRLRGATQLLRAAGFAFHDDSLAALPGRRIALKKGGTTHDNHAALTLCRLGFWRLGEFDCFDCYQARTRARWSKSLAISAMLDLSIEAASHLIIYTCPLPNGWPLDALKHRESTPKGAAGLATFRHVSPAQVLYEEGCLDLADTLLRDRLSVIKARGPIECALRAYLVLTRIARQRNQCDFAALLLREAEALGNAGAGRDSSPHASPSARHCCCGEARRGKLVSSWEYLDRYAESHRSGSGHSPPKSLDIAPLRVPCVLGRDPVEEAVAGLRQLYHQALEKRDLYVGCGLAVELAEMLEARRN